MGFVCPLLYSFLMGLTWAQFFKRKFINSLAPAYMMHILFVMLTGILPPYRLSIGIYGGMVLTVMAACFIIFQNTRNRKITRENVKSFLSAFLSDEGVLLFLAFYVFFYLINFYKHFLEWDEFMHWGMFLKENLRLDRPYCTSQLSFAHKDYVPAISLFETIWCRLSGGFSEPDAYRAVQVFMFSLLMPMFEKVISHANTIFEESSCERKLQQILKSLLFRFSAVLLVLIIPLVFNTKDCFRFYHTIYCDIAVGIVFYWCLFEVVRDCDDICYQMMILVIGCSTLVLAKMISMALLPLVSGLYFLRLVFFSEKKSSLFRIFISTVTITGIPTLLWASYSAYVSKWVTKVGNI